MKCALCDKSIKNEQFVSISVSGKRGICETCGDCIAMQNTFCTAFSHYRKPEKFSFTVTTNKHEYHIQCNKIR